MIEKTLYRFLSALLLTVSCLLCLGSTMGMQEIGWRHLLFSVLVLAVCSVWCCLDAKGRMVLLLSVGMAVVVACLKVEMQLLWQYFLNYFTIAFVCFGIQLLVEQAFVLKLVSAGILFVVLMTDLFTERDLSHMGAVCVIMYVVMILTEWTERNWQKKRAVNSRCYMMQIMPFLVLYFVLMAFVPASEEPYDWRFVKDAYANVKEVFLQISRNWIDSDREDFAFGTGGFGGSGKLLDHISEDDQTLMMIQGQASLKTNVYLVGKVYDTFDNNRWECTDKNTANERQLDTLETLYAVRRYDSDGEEKYLQKTGLRIWYEDFRTAYLFAPLKNYKLQKTENIPYKTIGGNYLFDKKQGYGLEYQTSFVQLNVDHPVFYEFLEQDLAEDGEIFAQVQEDYLKKADIYSLTDLDNHRQHIDSVYNVPVEISEELELWLKEVTKDAATDIDKLKAIEARLQQMVYTKSPGEIPDRVENAGEFLDYFLLDSQQGYCVYYATAFVLLARAQGLPARYVEGFCVPVDGTYKVLVTSKMAHAWPEVYIDGVGWIPFEPTPGYAEIRYTPWEVAAGGDGLGETANEMNHPTEENAEEEPDLEDEMVKEPAGKQENTANIFMIFGLTFVFAFFAAGIALLADMLLRKMRIKRSSIDELFRMNVYSNMRILAYLGYGRKENETLSELRRRAWAIMDHEEGEDKPEFAFLKLYEEYLYGEYPVTEEMLDKIDEEKLYLMQQLKKWKPVKYWYCRLRAL